MLTSRKKFNFREVLQKAADAANALDVDEPKLTSPVFLAKVLQEKHDKKQKDK